VLILREVPCKLKSFFHKAQVKIGSLSEIIEVGMPWSLKMWEMKNLSLIVTVLRDL
jgi:hypothetical protein